MRRELSPQEQRLSRLMQSADFRAVLLEWSDIVRPWVGPIRTDDIGAASWQNGRASFVSDLLDELQLYMPEAFALFEKERIAHVRSQLDRQLREGVDADADARRARLAGER